MLFDFGTANYGEKPRLEVDIARRGDFGSNWLVSRISRKI